MLNYLDIDLDLTADEIALRDAARQFAAEVLRPASVELDALPHDQVAERNSKLWEVMREAYRLGYHLQTLPEEVGGQGLSARERHLIAEELGWGSAGLGIAIGVASFPFYAATLTGNQDLIDAYVMPFVNDTEAKMIGCWAGTEPSHGSDMVLVGTPEFHDPAIKLDVRARLEGDQWTVSGQKAQWVSNGTIATHALTHLAIDPSMGLAGGGVLLVPLDTPGVTKGPPLNKIGQRDLTQGEIFWDDARFPRDHMLVDTGGYEMFLDAILAGANALMSATFTGLARAAFEEALEYAKVRVQGGKPLCEHQLIQKSLFEMFTKVEACRRISRAAFVYNFETVPPKTEYSIAAKVFCTQSAFEVASAAVQMFGGYGLSKEYLVEKLFRDARAALIEDGTNEVLSLAGARLLLNRYGSN